MTGQEIFNIDEMDYMNRDEPYELYDYQKEAIKVIIDNMGHCDDKTIEGAIFNYPLMVNGKTEYPLKEELGGQYQDYPSMIQKFKIEIFFKVNFNTYDETELITKWLNLSEEEKSLIYWKK